MFIKKYYVNPSVFKFVQLFTSDNISCQRHLAKYACECSELYSVKIITRCNYMYLNYAKLM